MSILGNICASIERIVHQSDEHVIAWSVEDHAECVDRTQKAYQKLQKLQKNGAQLDLYKAYDYAFGLKTEEPKLEKAPKPVKKARKIKTPKKVEEPAQN